MNKQKFFFKISYDGSSFNGWQNQKDGKSVQETIEICLSNILKQPTIIYGCGRTDAGVHAENYFFHAYIPQDKQNLKFQLNKHLPTQISVQEIIEVPVEANAQKDAELRVYTYYIHFEKNAFLSSFSSWYPKLELDYNILTSATKLIENHKDFNNFCLSPGKHYSTLCDIHTVEFYLNSAKNRLAFRFHGDHYLKSMIRLLVGELLEVGQGRTSLAEFESYLNNTVIKPRNHKAHPQGLHLSQVEYPFIPKTELRTPFSDEN